MGIFSFTPWAWLHYYEGMESYLAISFTYSSLFVNDSGPQCLSQDLETGCLKLAVVKFLGVQIFKGDHNVLIFKP